VNQTSKWKVNQIDRDRFARATISKLDKGNFTPCFSPLIQTQSEFDIYQKRILSEKENEHLAVFLMRVFDANKLLLPLINLKNTATIDAKPISSIYNNFLGKTIPIIDPATEYLDFEFHYDKLLSLQKQFVSTSSNELFTP